MTQHTSPLFCITGTLREAPTVRVRPMGDSGHPMPVLRIVLHNVGPSCHTVTAEQVFPLDGHAAAYARAKQLKPGMQLTVQAPIELMELHMHAVAHIHQVKPQTQPQEVCHA